MAHLDDKDIELPSPILRKGDLTCDYEEQWTGVNKPGLGDTQLGLIRGIEDAPQIEFMQSEMPSSLKKLKTKREFAEQAEEEVVNFEDDAP